MPVRDPSERERREAELDARLAKIERSVFKITNRTKNDQLVQALTPETLPNYQKTRMTFQAMAEEEFDLSESIDPDALPEKVNGHHPGDDTA